VKNAVAGSPIPDPLRAMTVGRTAWNGGAVPEFVLVVGAMVAGVALEEASKSVMGGVGAKAVGAGALAAALGSLT
jgi:hypothetical protein